MSQQAQRFANIAGHGRIGDIKPSRLHPPLQVLINLSQAQRLSGIPHRLQQLGRHREQFLEFVTQRRHQRRHRVLANGTPQLASLGLEEPGFLLRPAQLIAGINLRGSLFAQVQNLFPAVSPRMPQHQVGVRGRVYQVGFQILEQLGVSLFQPGNDDQRHPPKEGGGSQLAQAGQFISPDVDLGDFRRFHRPGLFCRVQGRSAQAGYSALGENPLFA